MYYSADVLRTASKKQCAQGSLSVFTHMHVCVCVCVCVHASLVASVCVVILALDCQAAPQLQSVNWKSKADFALTLS